MSSINEAYGTDIAFKSDLVKTASGDLATISGLDNLKDALFRRLITKPGSLAFRPTYGVGIGDFQNGINSLEAQRQLAGLIQEQFEEDKRVEKVLGVSVSAKDDQPETLRINVRIRAQGYSDAQLQFSPFEEG